MANNSDLSRDNLQPIEGFFFCIYSENYFQDLCKLLNKLS